MLIDFFKAVYNNYVTNLPDYDDTAEKCYLKCIEFGKDPGFLYKIVNLAIYKAVGM